MSIFGRHRHHVFDPFEGAPAWAIELDAKLNRLLETIMPLTAEVQALVDKVAANTDAVKAALAGLATENTQITALTQQVADLEAKLATGSPIDADDLAAIKQATVDLGDTNTAIAAAVPANVPPAPVS